ncbi:cytidylyltransferase domain-containing protein [Desulfospira joergensenii]|uniref:cytidylyltransferase domain-containing protein n=1 Tax=Desulfospira joergensenii TaxID=53329 RepID=UPI0003B3B45F|nr:NTP transferase domain-containing protein [Desulfospira joergensenii]
MKTGFLITARLKSTRLKLKLLLPLNGKTVIERVIERAKSVSGIDEIVLCTSKESQDLPLVRIAADQDIYYFNGHPDDVLMRLHDAAIFYHMDYFIGITADNPLFSIYYANILCDMVKQDPSIDFAVTTGLPVGMNIYAIKTKALQVICKVKQEIDTEIWGSLINRPEIFNVVEYPVKKEDAIPVERVTLDEPLDFMFFKKIYNSYPPDYVIEEPDLQNLLIGQPDMKDINSCVVQASLTEEKRIQIDDFFKSHHDHILKVKNQIYSV